MKIKQIAWAACCLTAVSQLHAASKAASSGSMAYALPQTRLEVKINVKHTVYKRGPYAEFANRMLGIQQLPGTDQNTWRIVSTEVSTSPEIDNREIYTMNYGLTSDNARQLLQITSAGLIADAQARSVLSQQDAAGGPSEKIMFMNYTDKELTDVHVDTFYKMIMNDTAFIRQPVVQQIMTSKTKESMARDVANQIFELRENRFQLLIGNVDHYPDGLALQTALKELAREEELLLSMFVGAQYEEVIPYRFSVAPEALGTGTLCYFSPGQGISGTVFEGAAAIGYQISSTFNNHGERPTGGYNSLIYRIPVQCDVQILSGKKILTHESLPFYQFGPYVTFFL